MRTPNPILPVLATSLLLLAGCRGAILEHLPRGGVPSPEPGFRTVGPPLLVTNPYQVYVNYAVPPERVRALLPARFELVTRRLTPDTDARAFLTVTWFPQCGLCLCAGGAAHRGYDELNVRIPVRDRVTGRTLSWMLPALAEPPFGLGVAAFSGLCVADVPLRLSCEARTGAEGRRLWINRDRGGERLPRALVEELAGAAPAPAGFETLEAARALFLDPPLAAHDLPRPGRIGWMHIEQPRLLPRAARLRRMRLPHLAAARQLSFEEQQKAHSVFVTQRVEGRVLILEPCGAPQETVPSR